ncbi:hypothetical protein H4696_009773 [Amycolatopsis lexingtonensis]|uniref:Uncharacterized protein n=2 Tax=Amycolatopsis lexingtonensis TaxID=218822 RepID=A0ABR9IHL9_9PSEU|nr:conjugal transfer protein TraH [Amycolatopsis lexingtonensis]MBE1502673.1 hypothetical protein [Amycolatopsis lexingtonensis]
MTDRCRTRQETAVAWTTAHAAELAGVGLPLIGGLVFTPWLDLVSLVAAALWAANEFRLRRTTATARQAAVTAAPARPALATTTDHTGSEPSPGEAGSRREVTR